MLAAHISVAAVFRRVSGRRRHVGGMSGAAKLAIGSRSELMRRNSPQRNRWPVSLAPRPPGGGALRILSCTGSPGFWRTVPGVAMREFTVGKRLMAGSNSSSRETGMTHLSVRPSVTPLSTSDKTTVVGTGATYN